MDYEKLGLKVGLELHQQLNSDTKLFCRCPITKSETFPLQLSRRLHPVQSELGEKDPAALFEYFRNRSFVYRANAASTCLVEMDEQPPRELNKKALTMALQISRLLNCDLVDEIHFMRKMVIDGSAVSSFQRTALISTNGYIDTSFGQLGIQTIGLEEDSAPALSRGNAIEYRLDRLGIPLVEIATDPDIHTPEQAKEAAEKIGTLLRSVEVVRGIGSIRQDVNISIAEGARVEVKGFQELDKIPELVENEVKRQTCLLEIKQELKERGFRGASVASDVTKLFQKTKCNFVKKAIQEHKKVYGLKLDKFVNLLKKPCGDRSFGKELHAYPASYGFGIIHSDEDLEKYNLSLEFNELRKELNAKQEDLVAIVIGVNAERAIEKFFERVNYCAVGIPEETRVADQLGSKYARPLPGAGRMYPESDVPAIKVTRGMKNVKLPKTLEEKQKELDLPKDLSKQLVKSVFYSDFLEMTKQYKPKDTLMIANIFLSHYKDLVRRGYDVLKIGKNDLLEIIKKIDAGELPKSSLTKILEDLASGFNMKYILEKYALISETELEEIVKEAIEKNPGKGESVMMGIVMGKTKGKADGKKVSELVKKLR